LSYDPVRLFRRPVFQRHSLTLLTASARHFSQRQPCRYIVPVPCFRLFAYHSCVFLRWQYLQRTWHFTSSFSLTFKLRDQSSRGSIRLWCGRIWSTCKFLVPPH